MREALALRPVEPRDRPNGAGEAPDERTPRERMAVLVRRVEAGDLTAIDPLRRLLLGVETGNASRTPNKYQSRTGKGGSDGHR